LQRKQFAKGDSEMKILMRQDGSEKWKLVGAAEYTAETELQKLLAESPSLISVGEILEGAPPLLAAIREVGLPGSGSTDILAFNERGDVVIIECKLAANQEIKRKVIAQVLEYGAYLWGMNYEELNQKVYMRANKNLAELVGELSGDPEWDEEEFRTTIEENLANGSFVLVIAVDEINEELSRTIRFLNTCGDPKFAFTALEMKRFHKDNTEILVPHIYGTLTQSKSKLESRKRKQWTESEYFASVQDQLSPYEIEVISNLYQWTKVNADRVWFGTGTEKGSFTFHYLLDGKTVSIFSVYTNGDIIINYGWLSRQIDINLIEEFHHNLTKIETFAHTPADFTRWPSMKIIDVFPDQSEYLEKFKNLVEEFERKVKG
jgi:hypothetical protein